VKQHRKDVELNQLIDREIFDRLVEKWGMDKWVRELNTWELTSALITAVTLRLNSYREIEQTLGIPRATLGDALAKRFSGFFTELCDQILLVIKGLTSDRKVKRAIRQIKALDSSKIKVHGSLFSSPGWQQSSAHGHSAAAKLHVIWDVDEQWVDDCVVTGDRSNDSPVSRWFNLKSGAVYVFDRAYNDLKFWIKIRKAGSDFVTRLKRISIKGLKEGRIAEQSDQTGVLYEGTYTPCKASIYTVPAEDRDKLEFRYIVYRDPETGKTFYFVTSDWTSPAQDIADIYKKRWAVELLFRWFKGHLGIRYLATKNKNAVKIQLAIAVLVQLLLRLKKLRDRYHGTLWELLLTIRTALLTQGLTTSAPADGCRWKRPTGAGLADACT
jgi:hypothetical protein